MAATSSGISPFAARCENTCGMRNTRAPWSAMSKLNGMFRSCSRSHALPRRSASASNVASFRSKQRHRTGYPVVWFTTTPCLCRFLYTRAGSRVVCARSIGNASMR